MSYNLKSLIIIITVNQALLLHLMMFHFHESIHKTIFMILYHIYIIMCIRVVYVADVNFVLIND